VRGYARVVELDSGFVLARYKQFLAELQAEPTEARLREAVAAVRDVVPRVGARERELLSAYVILFDSADVAGAEARLTRLVARDSTFLDGWFALGEVRYHFGGLAGLPPDSAESAFRRALELWPGAAPAEMHLVALDLWFGRARSARERMGRYLAQDSSSTVARAMALGSDVLFGSLTQRRAVLERLAALDERVIELGAITGVSVARDRTDLALARLAFEELARPGRSPRVRREGANFVIATLLSEGRWQDARTALARYRAELPDDPELPQWPAVAAALGFGTASPLALDRPGRLDPARVPFSAFASGWPQRYAAGRRALAEGDTATALAHFLAQDLLASVGDGVVRGPVWLARGRILAGRGDRAGAQAYLRRVTNLLAYADPPWDAVRDSAAAELRRLGGRP
jgi:tetratricopeptide (TPR) repeat protein